MSAPHLLSLSALHAAAPGVLDIVFGADGDFEGAPEWRCMCWDSRDSAYVATITRSALDAFVFGGRIPPQFALDCRLPSVAARLAGLCARALDVEATGQAWATEAGEIRPEFWVLRYCDTAGYAASVAWCKATGRPDRRGLSPCPPETPSLPAGLADVPSFLAALTLAMAPKIAALRSPA